MSIRLIQTLLYKELLRYWYNPGPLVIVGALVALAILISANRHMFDPNAQQPVRRAECLVFAPQDHPIVKTLQEESPDIPVRFRFASRDRFKADRKLTPIEMVIVMDPSKGGERSSSASDGPSEEIVKARLLYTPTTAPLLPPLEEWFRSQTHAALNVTDRVQIKREQQLSGSDITPRLLAAFIMFSIFLHSFQLFLTTTSEERDRKQLLALLLTPASASNVILAKSLFYITLSVVVSAVVQGCYQPALLIEPFFWMTVTLTAVGYVSIATIILLFVRRHSTINSIPMVYLLLMGIVIVLSEALPVFKLLRLGLLEHFLLNQVRMLADGTYPLAERLLVQFGQVLVVGGWVVLAWWQFCSRSRDLARAG